MICFCYFCQKNCFWLWAWPMLTSVLQIGPEKAIFRGFNQIFFRTSWLQQKLLISIESPNTFHWKSRTKEESGCGLRGQNLGQVRGPMVWKSKETSIFSGLFSNFAWGIHLKARRDGYRNTWVGIEGQTK